MSERRSCLAALAWRVACSLAIANGGALLAHSCAGNVDAPGAPVSPDLRARIVAAALGDEPPAVATTPTTDRATPTPTAAVTSEPATSGPVPVEPTRAEWVAWFALAQVGKPYVFGADGPDTFDCSGLARAALARVGVDVPHHAAWQASLGEPVRAGDIRAGDLVFTAGGRPRHDLGHVGIAVSGREWVDAPAPGRDVERAPIPFGRVQAVRRLVGR